MHRLLIVILPVLLALAATATAKPAQTVAAGFDGVLEIAGETDNPFKIKLDGELWWSAPKLRVDFLQSLTQESMIALVDFEAQEATLLYPDTLNGQQLDLTSFSKADYFQRVRDLVSTKPGDTPPGWESKTVEDKEAKALGQTHTQLNGPAGEHVDLWRDSDKLPAKMHIQTKKWNLILNLNNVEYDKAISADRFTYSSDYTVIQVEDLPDDGLAGL